MKRRQLIRQITIGTATASTLTACGQQTQFFGAQTQLVSQPRVECEWQPVGQSH